MNTKKNRRFKAMDQAMKTAMLALMQEKPTHAIGAGEICLRADVNRSTFYAHYDDVFDLIEAMADDLAQEFLPEINDMVIGQAYAEYLRPYFAHIKKYRSFYKPAMLCRNPLSMEKQLVPLIERIVIPRCHAAGIVDERRIMYHAAFFQSGLASVMKNWLKKDCEEDIQTILNVLI